MRKKFKSKKPEVQPDPKTGSAMVTTFINKIMLEGQKSVAQKIVYDAFDVIAEKTKQDAIDVFEKAIKNASPYLEVKSRRIGGANYQVPIEVREGRRVVLAMRWIIDAARGKKGQPMAKALANELMAAAKGEGGAIKKREDVQKMAEANKAFAHYAW